MCCILGAFVWLVRFGDEGEGQEGFGFIFFIFGKLTKSYIKLKV